MATPHYVDATFTDAKIQTYIHTMNSFTSWSAYKASADFVNTPSNYLFLGSTYYLENISGAAAARFALALANSISSDANADVGKRQILSIFLTSLSTTAMRHVVSATTGSGAAGSLMSILLNKLDVNYLDDTSVRGLNTTIVQNILPATLSALPPAIIGALGVSIFNRITATASNSTQQTNGVLLCLTAPQLQSLTAEQLSAYLTPWLNINSNASDRITIITRQNRLNEVSNNLTAAQKFGLNFVSAVGDQSMMTRLFPGTMNSLQINDQGVQNYVNVIVGSTNGVANFPNGWSDYQSRDIAGKWLFSAAQLSNLSGETAVRFVQKLADSITSQSNTGASQILSYFINLLPIPALVAVLIAPLNGVQGGLMTYCFTKLSVADLDRGNTLGPSATVIRSLTNETLAAISNDMMSQLGRNAFDRITATDAQALPQTTGEYLILTASQVSSLSTDKIIAYLQAWLNPTPSTNQTTLLRRADRLRNIVDMMTYVQRDVLFHTYARGDSTSMMERLRQLMANGSTFTNTSNALEDSARGFITNLGKWQDVYHRDRYAMGVDGTLNGGHPDLLSRLSQTFLRDLYVALTPKPKDPISVNRVFDNWFNNGYQYDGTGARPNTLERFGVTAALTYTKADGSLLFSDAALESLGTGFLRTYSIHDLDKLSLAAWNVIARRFSDPYMWLTNPPVYQFTTVPHLSFGSVTGILALPIESLSYVFDFLSVDFWNELPASEAARLTVRELNALPLNKASDLSSGFCEALSLVIFPALDGAHQNIILRKLTSNYYNNLTDAQMVVLNQTFTHFPYMSGSTINNLNANFFNRINTHWVGGLNNPYLGSITKPEVIVGLNASFLNAINTEVVAQFSVNFFNNFSAAAVAGLSINFMNTIPAEVVATIAQINPSLFNVFNKNKCLGLEPSKYGIWIARLSAADINAYTTADMSQVRADALNYVAAQNPAIINGLTYAFLLNIHSAQVANLSDNFFAAIIDQNIVAQLSSNSAWSTKFVQVQSVDISGAGITAGSGSLKIGSQVTITLRMSQAVTVVGSGMTLSLNNGGVATYQSGSASSNLVFSYTVGAGQNTSDVSVTAVNLNGSRFSGRVPNMGGAIVNPNGVLVVDLVTPTVVITSNVAALTYANSAIITFSLSETSTNFTLADVRETYSSGSGGSFTNFTGVGTSYTAVYTAGLGRTTPVTISVDAAKFSDAAGNDNLASTRNVTMSVDTTTTNAAVQAFNFVGTWDVYQQDTSVFKLPNNFFSTANTATQITAFFTKWIELWNASTATQTDEVKNRRAGIFQGFMNLLLDTNFGYLLEMPANIIGLISSTTLDNLSAVCVQKFSTVQLQQLTFAQINGMNGANFFNALTAMQITNYIAANPSRVFAFFSQMHARTVNQLNATFFNNLTGSQMFWLNQHFLGNVSINTFSTMNQSVRDAVEHNVALNLPEAQKAIVLTATYYNNLSVDRARRLSYADLSYLLSNTQIITALSDTFLNKLTGSVVAQFSATLLNSLSPSVISSLSYNFLSSISNTNTSPVAQNLSTSFVDAIVNQEVVSQLSAFNTVWFNQFAQVQSVAVTGAGIVNGNGTVKAGSTITLTVTMSRAVTFSNTPNVSLMLNDNGVASYISGSGSTSLVFQYTVAAGENTNDLMVTGLRLNNGTTMQGRVGNFATVTQNPLGTLVVDTSAPLAPPGLLIFAPEPGVMPLGQKFNAIVDLSTTQAQAGDTIELAIPSNFLTGFVGVISGQPSEVTSLVRAVLTAEDVTAQKVFVTFDSTSALANIFAPSSALLSLYNGQRLSPLYSRVIDAVGNVGLFGDTLSSTTTVSANWLLSLDLDKVNTKVLNALSDNEFKNVIAAKFGTMPVANVSDAILSALAKKIIANPSAVEMLLPGIAALQNLSAEKLYIFLSMWNYADTVGGVAIDHKVPVSIFNKIGSEKLLVAHNDIFKRFLATTDVVNLNDYYISAVAGPALMERNLNENPLNTEQYQSLNGRQLDLMTDTWEGNANLSNTKLDSSFLTGLSNEQKSKIKLAVLGLVGVEIIQNLPANFWNAVGNRAGYVRVPNVEIPIPRNMPPVQVLNNMTMQELIELGILPQNVPAGANAQVINAAAFNAAGLTNGAQIFSAYSLNTMPYALLALLSAAAIALLLSNPNTLPHNESKAYVKSLVFDHDIAMSNVRLRATLTMSQNVTGFTADDIGCDGTISNFSGSGKNYTFEYKPPSNTNGQDILHIDAGKFLGTDRTSNDEEFNAIILVDTITQELPTLSLLANQDGLLILQVKLGSMAYDAQRIELLVDGVPLVSTINISDVIDFNFRLEDNLFGRQLSVRMYDQFEHSTQIGENITVGLDEFNSVTLDWLESVNNLSYTSYLAASFWNNLSDELIPYLDANIINNIKKFDELTANFLNKISIDAILQIQKKQLEKLIDVNTVALLNNNWNAVFPKLLSMAMYGFSQDQSLIEVGLGKKIFIELNLSAAATWGGFSEYPYLRLSNGENAFYISGAGTDKLTFEYIVGGNQNADSLSILGWGNDNFLFNGISGTNAKINLPTQILSSETISVQGTEGIFKLNTLEILKSDSGINLSEIQEGVLVRASLLNTGTRVGDKIEILGNGELITGLNANNKIIYAQKVITQENINDGSILVTLPKGAYDYGIEGLGGDGYRIISAQIKRDSNIIAAGGTNTVLVDVSSPHLLFVQTDYIGVINRSMRDISYVYNFSQDVENLSIDDFTISNGVIYSVVKKDNAWVVHVIPDLEASGKLSITLLENKIFDQAGNGNISYITEQDLFTILPTVPEGNLSFTEILPEVNLVNKQAGILMRYSLNNVNAHIGDKVEILLNGISFANPVYFTLKQSDLDAGYITGRIPYLAGWGNDGVKLLQARMIDFAGNVGVSGDELSIILNAQDNGFNNANVLWVPALENTLTSSEIEKGFDVVVDLLGMNCLIGDAIEIIVNNDVEHAIHFILTQKNIDNKIAIIKLSQSTGVSITQNLQLVARIVNENTTGGLGGKLVVNPTNVGGFINRIAGLDDNIFSDLDISLIYAIPNSALSDEMLLKLARRWLHHGDEFIFDKEQYENLSSLQIISFLTSLKNLDSTKINLIAGFINALSLSRIDIQLKNFLATFSDQDKIYLSQEVKNQIIIDEHTGRNNGLLSNLLFRPFLAGNSPVRSPIDINRVLNGMVEEVRAYLGSMDIVGQDRVNVEVQVLLDYLNSLLSESPLHAAVITPSTLINLISLFTEGTFLFGRTSSFQGLPLFLLPILRAVRLDNFSGVDRAQILAQLARLPSDIMVQTLPGEFVHRLNAGDLAILLSQWIQGDSTGLPLEIFILLSNTQIESMSDDRFAHLWAATMVSGNPHILARLIFYSDMLSDVALEVVNEMSAANIKVLVSILEELSVERRTESTNRMFLNIFNHLSQEAAASRIIRSTLLRLMGAALHDEIDDAILRMIPAEQIEVFVREDAPYLVDRVVSLMRERNGSGDFPLVLTDLQWNSLPSHVINMFFDDWLGNSGSHIPIEIFDHIPVYTHEILFGGPPFSRFAELSTATRERIFRFLLRQPSLVTEDFLSSFTIDVLLPELLIFDVNFIETWWVYLHREIMASSHYPALFDMLVRQYGTSLPAFIRNSVPIDGVAQYSAFLIRSMSDEWVAQVRASNPDAFVNLPVHIRLALLASEVGDVSRYGTLTTPRTSPELEALSLTEIYALDATVLERLDVGVISGLSPRFISALNPAAIASLSDAFMDTWLFSQPDLSILRELPSAWIERLRWDMDSGYGQINVRAVLEYLGIPIPAGGPSSLMPSYLREIGLDFYGALFMGRGIRALVIDSGVSEIYRASLIRAVEPGGVGNGLDLDAHGTMMISALSAPWGGIDAAGGVAPGITVVSSRESGVVDIARAIMGAISSDVDIISISLGAAGDNFLLRDAIAAARRAGILVSVSAGNGQREGESLTYPARYAMEGAGVFAVGATELVNGSFELLDFSSHAASIAPYPYVTAPGAGIPVYGLRSVPYVVPPIYSSRYAPMQHLPYPVETATGTSPSAAIVAGAVGLVAGAVMRFVPGIARRVAVGIAQMGMLRTATPLRLSAAFPRTDFVSSVGSLGVDPGILAQYMSVVAAPGSFDWRPFTVGLDVKSPLVNPPISAPDDFLS